MAGIFFQKIRRKNKTRPGALFSLFLMKDIKSSAAKLHGRKKPGGPIKTECLWSGISCQGDLISVEVSVERFPDEPGSDSAIPVLQAAVPPRRLESEGNWKKRI